MTQPAAPSLFRLAPSVGSDVLGLCAPCISPLAIRSGVKWRSKLTNSVTRTVMTLDRLYGLIAQGFGQGRNDDYKSWIRVTRSLSSPKSNILVVHLPIHARGLNLLAGTEYNAGDLAAWLGALEIREQLPLWPSEALSPLHGLHAERDLLLPLAPGLVEIAKDAGIDHGTYVGGDIPYVATTDLVLRIGRPPHDRLVFWSVKPLEKIVVGESAARVRERLELERRYAIAVNACHQVIDGTEMTSSLIANLGWLMPTRSSLNEFASSNYLEDYAGAFESNAASGDPLGACIDSAGRQCSIEPERVQAIFRTAAWLGRIDVDLGVPILMSKPPTRGGKQRKLRMQNELLGGAA